MNCTILLHSTTGNTRLVARYAAARLRKRGHVCTVHDVVRHPVPPALDAIDLLGVASPTMYFRQTQVIERFIERMPPAPRPTPAFLLGTASGDPGAHFSMQAYQLAHKDFVTLAAAWVIFPTNWPPHRQVGRGTARLAPFAESLSARHPGARAVLAIPFPDVGAPAPRDRARVERMLDRVVRRAESRDVDPAPRPEDLYRGPAVTTALGRLLTVRMMRKATAIAIDRSRCSRCGTCVAVCPIGCIGRASRDEVPTVGTRCTGCWACYNHCPEGAITGWKSDGSGRYAGPGPAELDLFRVEDEMGEGESS